MRARTVLLVCNTIAICASYLVGDGVLRAPSPLGISLAFYALFIVPGIAAGNLLFRSPSKPVEAACRVFCGGVVFASIVVCVGFVPGVTYRIISAVAASLGCLLAIIDRVRPIAAGRERRVAIENGGRGEPWGEVHGPALAAALLCFGLCFLFFYGSGDLGWNTDSLDHVSYVRRSIDGGSLFPLDSFYREGDGASFDVRKGLWHPVLSLWAYQAHAAPDALWRLLPAFMSFFAFASFLFFGMELLGSTRYALLGAVFMLLFYGGEGVQWFTKIGFSRNVTQVMFWASAAFLLKYYRLGEMRCLVAACFVSAAACAFHVVYALLIGVFLLGMLLYAGFSRSGAAWRSSFWRSVLAQTAALAAPLAVRWRAIGAPLNEIHAHRQGMLVLSDRFAMVDPAELISCVGLVLFFALLMAPVYFLVAARVRRTLVFTLTIVPVLLVLNPLVAPFLERRLGYLHYRILDAAPLMFFCALVVGGLARHLVRGGPSQSGLARRAGAVVGLAIFLYYPALASAHQFAAGVERIVKRGGGLPSSYRILMETLERTIPDHSVIVSDPLTSYVVSAYTDHFVVVTLDQHGSPADGAALDRLRAVRDVMSPAVPLAESFPWLRRWKADYVLLNRNLPAGADFFGTVLTEGLPLAAEKFRSCPRALRETLEQNGFVLFAVTRDSLVASSDSCGVALAGPLSCAGGKRGPGGAAEAGCGVALEAVSLGRESVAPGDILRGSFCWRASDTISFGLPLELTIRIDTAFPRGRWYREWYGKQYRRIAERRRGVFYRYTWDERLRSGFSYPDRWEAGASVRQEFSLVLSRWMAPGRYDLRVKIRRMPYLPNRRLADYLSNDDSAQGIPAGTITVGRLRSDQGGPSAGWTVARPIRGER